MSKMYEGVFEIGKDEILRKVIEEIGKSNQLNAVLPKEERCIFQEKDMPNRVVFTGAENYNDLVKVSYVAFNYNSLGIHRIPTFDFKVTTCTENMDKQ